MNNAYQLRLFFIIFFGLLVFLLFPFLYLGHNSCFWIPDNLDSEFVYIHLLKTAGLLFSFKPGTLVPSVMNGIPRVLYHSEFSFIRFLFLILPSFWAYVVNFALIHLIGFIGMYLFARDYLLKDMGVKTIMIFALTFSIIPCFGLYGLPILGQPLLIWAFLNISYNHKSVINWIIICLYPGYAHFAFIAPFIITALGLYGIYRLFLKDQAISKSYFIALFLLTCSFVAFNSLTLLSFASHTDYISHRVEWVWIPVSLRAALEESFNIFLYGHFHSSTFNALPIYLLALFALFIVRKDRSKVIIIVGSVIVIAILSFFYATYPTLCFYSKGFAHILSVFQFRRFIFLIPTILFIILGLSIRYLSNTKFSLIIYPMIIWQIVLILSENAEIRYNYAKIFTHKETYPSFHSFFSEDLFADISKYIGKPQNEYRVVSVGVQPSIAQYNGFYTLDSYQNNYPLAYKHEFRKIIAGELGKNQHLKEYFDGWGNRCYVFSDELFNEKINPDIAMLKTYKGRNVSIHNLNINIEQLKSMGAQYIFSVVPIDNADALHLKYEKEFSDKSSLWDIYLYKI